MTTVIIALFYQKVINTLENSGYLAASIYDVCYVCGVVGRVATALGKPTDLVVTFTLPLSYRSIVASGVRIEFFLSSIAHFFLFEYIIKYSIKTSFSQVSYEWGMSIVDGVIKEN